MQPFSIFCLFMYVCICPSFYPLVYLVVCLSRSFSCSSAPMDSFSLLYTRALYLLYTCFILALYLLYTCFILSYTFFILTLYSSDNHMQIALLLDLNIIISNLNMFFKCLYIYNYTFQLILLALHLINLDIIISR